MPIAENKKGNILLVANYDSNVGYAWWLMETFWIEIARHFRAQGRTCYLIYPTLSTIPRHIADSDIQVLQHDFSDHSVSASLRLWKLIRNNNLHAAYLTDRPYHSRYYWLLRLFGLRCLVVHDHTPGERPPVRGWRRLLKTWLYVIPGLTCDYFVGVSRFVYDRMLANACAPPERCAFVLNGIHPINRDPALKFYAHEEFGIPRDATIAVTTGRATYYKGIDFLIRAAARVVNDDRHGHAYFIHCGSGPDLDRFKALARELGLTNRFIFAGQRSDVRKILQSCDIGVQASKGEAFSLSILEYLSAGLATLVPDNCGNAEAVQDRVNGLLYTPGDLVGATNALQTLLRDASLRSRLTEAGMESVTNRFNIQRACRELVAVLDSRL